MAKKPNAGMAEKLNNTKPDTRIDETAWIKVYVLLFGSLFLFFIAAICKFIATILY
jgi:hypothetical protein